MDRSQFSTPFIVAQNGAVTGLQRVPLSGGDAEFRYDESWLQSLLFENPQSLPISEIDTAYQDLIPVCTELNTPAGPIDILYTTPAGKLVLLEAKLWRNPEARRRVIGQVLDYAKELNRWDYEELQKQIARRVSRSGNVLYQLVCERFPEVGEAEFVDEVSRSLASGRFLLLIVGDGIREGAGAIANFLTDVGQLRFTLGLIEVGIYQVPNGSTLVQPRIVAKTVIVDRTVVELASADLRIRTDESAEDDSDDDTFYRQFWSELLAELSLDDAAQRVPGPAKAQNLWFTLPPGASQAWISAYFAGSSNQVGVYFRMAKTELAELAYQSLADDKHQILSELPEGVEWEDVRGHHNVGISMAVDNVWAATNRDSIKQFFSVNINAFVNAFRRRMERIAEDLDAR